MENTLNDGSITAVDAEIALLPDTTSPTSCTSISPINEWEGKVTSHVVTAYEYYMKTPGIGSYDERLAAFMKEATSRFTEFARARATEYNGLRCIYDAGDWNHGGRITASSVVCQTGSYLLKDTLQVMPDEPQDLHKTEWDREAWPTRFTFWTGHRGGSSRVLVKVQSKLLPKTISENVTNELRQFQHKLRARDIPTELPPIDSYAVE